MFLIENKISPELISFLFENGLIDKTESIIAIEKPGEGNMNQVLRITTNKQTFILKQSRDFVNKYPTIEAPIERIYVEAKFYNTIAENSFLYNQMPKILSFYPEQYLLALEDLGPNIDFNGLYENKIAITENEIITLTNYLNTLHSLAVETFPSNEALKLLNHFHIFNFPFDQNNNFDLDNIQNGLQEISTKYKSDIVLKNTINGLGRKYLETGSTLLHGDFYPGSWLNTNIGIKIIDPEFGHLGYAEFDLGIFIAHIIMAGKEGMIKTILLNYNKSASFSDNLMYSFAGVEIMRRLLGVAQLPITLTIETKKQLLAKAYELIISNHK